MFFSPVLKKQSICNFFLCGNQNPKPAKVWTLSKTRDLPSPLARFGRNSRWHFSRDFFIDFLDELSHCEHNIREAFQSKKQRNLGISPIRGGSSHFQKVPSFSWEKFNTRGGSSHFQKVSSFSWEKFKIRGVFDNQKSPKFQRVSETKK